MKQPNATGLYYKNNDFNEKACIKLYDQFNQGLIEKFLNSSHPYFQIV